MALVSSELSDKEKKGLSPSTALLSEDILEQLVDYLPFYTLKSCRLVNHLWNHVFTKGMIPRCQKISFRTCAPRVIRWGLEEMLTLSELLSSSWNFPCTEFWIEESIFWGHVDGQTVLLQFLHRVRNIVSYLELEETVDYTVTSKDCRFWESDFYPKEVHYSKLKTLRVLIAGDKDTQIDRDKERPDFLQMAANVLATAPNLEKLYFVICSDSNSVSQFFTKLSQAPAVVSKKIRYLTLEGSLDDKHLNVIRELNLQLKRIHLKPSKQAKISGECFHQFLTGTKESLLELNLTISNDFEFSVKLPKLRNVTKMNISITRLHTNQTNTARNPVLATFPDIIYAQQLSALRCLSFKKETVQILSQFFKGASVNSVTELELPHKLEDPLIILQALRKFPKLKKIWVPAVKQIVKPVFELGGSIEELTIQIVHNGGQTVDELLTGYGHLTLRHLGHEQLEQRERTNWQPKPFLQKLKVLRLVPVRINGRIKITDISCRLVLLKMNALTCLDFKYGGRPSGISTAVMKRMRDKFSVWYKDRYRDRNGNPE